MSVTLGLPIIFYTLLGTNTV